MRQVITLDGQRIFLNQISRYSTRTLTHKVRRVTKVERKGILRFLLGTEDVNFEDVQFTVLTIEERAMNEQEGSRTWHFYDNLSVLDTIAHFAQNPLTAHELPSMNNSISRHNPRVASYYDSVDRLSYRHVDHIAAIIEELDNHFEAIHL